MRLSGIFLTCCLVGIFATEPPTLLQKSDIESEIDTQYRTLDHKQKRQTQIYPVKGQEDGVYGNKPRTQDEKLNSGYGTAYSENSRKPSIYFVKPMEDVDKPNDPKINIYGTLNRVVSNQQPSGSNVYAVNPIEQTQNEEYSKPKGYGSNHVSQQSILQSSQPNIYAVNPEEAPSSYNSGSSRPYTYNVNPSEQNYNYGNSKPNIYPVNPVRETSRPQASRPNIYPTYNENDSLEHQGGNPPSQWGEKGPPPPPPPRPTSVQPSFQPILLSTQPNKSQEAVESEKIPKVVITRDESIYAKGNQLSALEPKDDVNCEKSVTKANGNEVCKGQLIFQDDFDILNPNKWRHDIRIPSKPDYEFVSYIQSKNNTYIEDGVLVISPTLLSEWGTDMVPYGHIQLDDCNLVVDGGSCFKQAKNFNVLPPILSARLRSRHGFSFQYGRVEIRAKMPQGDWVYPEIWLESKDSSYGKWYMSGRVVIGLSRGNDIISGPKQETMGRQLMNAGCLFRKNSNIAVNYEKYHKKMNTYEWHNDFHNYTVVWKPDSMEFFLDGDSLGTCKAPNLRGKSTAPWRRGDTMAPFDKEFYITLGVAAGGISEFPDDITSGKHAFPKPWKNVGAKAVWNFYEDEDTWSRTWNKDTALRIDSVNVYAL